MSASTHLRRSVIAFVVLLVVSLASGSVAWWLAERYAGQRDDARQERRQTAAAVAPLTARLAEACATADGRRALLEQGVSCGVVADAQDEVQDVGETDDPDPVDDPDPNDPEIQDPEIQDPERQQPEEQEGEVNEAEIQDDEVDDPEVQEPEVQDPEVDDPDPDDPDPDDPDPNSALQFAVRDECNPGEQEATGDPSLTFERGGGVVTLVLTCTVRTLPDPPGPPATPGA